MAKAAAPAKAKASRSKKDPNAPKRATTAYIFFSTEKRPEIIANNPDIAFGEIARETSALWRALSDEEKQVYVDKAEADKLRYQKEKEEYDAKQKDE